MKHLFRLPTNQQIIYTDNVERRIEDDGKIAIMNEIYRKTNCHKIPIQRLVLTPKNC